MKKSLGLKICAGIAVVSALALLPTKAFAINTKLTLGTKNMFCGEPNCTSKYIDTTTEEVTATYDGDKKYLYLTNYKGGGIETDIDSLTIIVTDNSEISSTSKISSTGSVIFNINNNKSLTVKGGVDLSGAFVLSSGTLDLGEGALKVTNAGLKASGGILKAGTITLNDTDSTTQSIITVSNGAVVKATKSISSVYSFAATEKGISLGNSICSNPKAEISNINGSGTAKVTTTFTTTAAPKGITNGIELSAAACSGKTADVENPDTVDMVYVYAALLVASSAILGYRHYIAKR